MHLFGSRTISVTATGFGHGFWDGAARPRAHACVRARRVPHGPRLASVSCVCGAAAQCRPRLSRTTPLHRPRCATRHSAGGQRRTARVRVGGVCVCVCECGGGCGGGGGGAQGWKGVGRWAGPGGGAVPRPMEWRPPTDGCALAAAVGAHGAAGCRAVLTAKEALLAADAVDEELERALAAVQAGQADEDERFGRVLARGEVRSCRRRKRRCELAGWWHRHWPAWSQ